MEKKDSTTGGVHLLQKLIDTRNDLEFLKDYLDLDENWELLSGKEGRITELIQLLNQKQKSFEVLCFILKEEVQNSKTRLSLLRSGSLGSNLLKVYWFTSEGKEYLKLTVLPSIQEAISLTKSKPLEIDPTKASKKDVEKKYGQSH